MKEYNQERRMKRMNDRNNLNQNDANGSIRSNANVNGDNGELESNNGNNMSNDNHNSSNIINGNNEPKQGQQLSDQKQNVNDYDDTNSSNDTYASAVTGNLNAGNCQVTNVGAGDKIDHNKRD